MSKKEKSKEAEESKEVSVKKENAVSEGFDLGQLQQDAGKGGQNIGADDMAIPIISILQSNSPQCKRSDGKYIEGAQEGMFYNNVTNEIYDGQKEGLVVIPCYFEKIYIEWKPDRGGLAGIHPADTPLRNDVIMKEDSDGRENPTLPNGNHLVETKQYYVLIVKENGQLDSAVIAMSSSALKASRTWNTLIKQAWIPGANGETITAPTFLRRYKLTTTVRTKDKHSWFGWSVEPLGNVVKIGVEELDKNAIDCPQYYKAGKLFHEAVSEGKVKVKQEQTDDSTPAGVVDDDEIPFEDVKQ